MFSFANVSAAAKNTGIESLSPNLRIDKVLYLTVVAMVEVLGGAEVDRSVYIDYI